MPPLRRCCGPCVNFTSGSQSAPWDLIAEKYHGPKCVMDVTNCRRVPMISALDFVVLIDSDATHVSARLKDKQRGETGGGA